MMQKEQLKEEIKSKDLKASGSVFIATGRRKEAIASVRLTPGDGKVMVNKMPYSKYFNNEIHRIIINQPLAATEMVGKFNISARLKGGGMAGQAGALRLGISRALVMADHSFMSILRKQGFLTRDPRAKERKKYGQKGARKRFQWTKR